MALDLYSLKGPGSFFFFFFFNQLLEEGFYSAPSRRIQCLSVPLNMADYSAFQGQFTFFLAGTYLFSQNTFSRSSGKRTGMN